LKPWQHGYELDYLKSLEKKFDDYNKYTLSPFAKYKKNNIAESLHKKTLVTLTEDTMLEIAVSKSSSNITMHGSTVIAKKQKGDITFGKLVGPVDTLALEIVKYKSNDCWMYVWAENAEHCKFAEDMGFCYVGPKITTYGEIFAIYYRGKPREFPKVDAAEYLSIKKVNDVDMHIIESIAKKITELPEFTNHYSNYNKGNSWGALSLRGYSDDPAFITKPIEMSDKWKEDNKDNSFKLQDTILFTDFPEVRDLLKQYGSKWHRIRLMRLAPGGGELERHTDQVDPDSGGSKGKLARIHFPLKTNDKVVFTVWDTKGKAQTIRMKKGECWFLDTRKAHMAINGGDEERIHLVVDIETEDELYGKLVG